MNYDQHELESDPGPIASEDWFLANLRRVMKVVADDDQQNSYYNDRDDEHRRSLQAESESGYQIPVPGAASQASERRYDAREIPQ